MTRIQECDGMAARLEELEMAQETPVVAGKASVRLQPFQPNHAKKCWLHGGRFSSSYVHSVEAATRLEAPVPCNIVVARHVPCVADLFALPAGFPYVLHTLWQATNVFNLTVSQVEVATKDDCPLGRFFDTLLQAFEELYCALLSKVSCAFQVGVHQCDRKASERCLYVRHISAHGSV